MDKRAKGWLALRGLWGKKRKRSELSASISKEQEEFATDNDHNEKNILNVQTRSSSIPKVSEEELRKIME